MMKTPIYIKSLKLKNVRTFSEVQLNLENEDGTIPQWTLIIGDNGIGKSTLLQCIAWMKPVSFKDGNKDKINPYITDEENETFLRIPRKTSTKTNSSTHIEALFVANKKLNCKVIKEDTCKTSMAITLKNGQLFDVIPTYKITSQHFYKNRVILYAYSASRRLGKLNINDPKQEDTIAQFLAEKTELLDAENILHTSNYAVLGAYESLQQAKTKKEKIKLDKEYKKYENYVKELKQMLVSILPNIDDGKNIIINAPKLLDKYELEGEVSLTTKYGLKIPFKNASLGYRTVISWTIDLAWRLFQEYPESQYPLKEAAIVLIDEIDLHLHPKWQKEIMQNLSTHFPNVQFIATAHSPLMVQPEFDVKFDNNSITIRPNYAIVKDLDEEVVVINDPKGIDGWRADQILTSEFFGLQSSRGPKYDVLMNIRNRLLEKKRLSKQDKKELDRTNVELSKLPSGETMEEIKNRELITELASQIKAGSIKIKL